MQKLTLFERFLLLVIMQVLYIAGIPAKHREGLSSLLYNVAMKGELKEEDLKGFE